MDEFIARVSPWRIVLLSGACLMFVVGGLWMAGIFGEPPPSRRFSPDMGVAIGWFIAAFFGLALFAIARKLFGEREILVLNTQGLRASQWSNQTIPWTEIEDVSTWSHRGSTSINLHLRNASLFPGSGLRGFLAGVNRRLTGGDIVIAMTSSDKSVGETLDAIQHFRATVR